MDEELKQPLDRLSKATQRTKLVPTADAIPAIVDPNEWQIGEIEEAVSEADREEFANETHVSGVLRKWGVGGV